MKKLKILSYLFLIVLGFSNCEIEKKNNNVLLAGLAIAAGSNCFSVPSQSVVTDGATVKTFNCSVSGKVYTCVPTDASNTIIRTYTSSTAAKLSVVDPPSYSNQHVQRGLAKRVEGATETTFVYNASHQLQTVSPSAVYSNLDEKGFPKTNSYGVTITYTYEGSRTIPTTVDDVMFKYTYDNNGWATKVSLGGGTPSTVVNTGSLGICE